MLRPLVILLAATLACASAIAETADAPVPASPLEALNKAWDAKKPEGHGGRIARVDPDADTKPAWVQFRDLFRKGGKPSARAMDYHGRTVELVGFLAPPPSEESPFMVFVGAPTSFCPYCTSVDEQDHLPYVLVYPENGQTGIYSRRRLRVTGRLDAGHGYDDMFGIHNDLRILNARIAYDGVHRSPVRPAEKAPVPVEGAHRPRRQGARPAPQIDYDGPGAAEIEEYDG